MRALVLAAGFGTRLRPLTEHVPKALVPIGDRPSAAHAVAAVRAAGCAPIAINAHHLAEMVAAFAAEEGLAISQEEAILGTAGGLAAARSVAGQGDYLVYNADVFFPGGVDLAPLLAAHAAGGAEATLLVRAAARGRLGNVGLDAEGRVVRLRGAAPAPGEVGSCDFLGVHVVGGGLALPAEGCLVGDVYIPALARGARLCALRHEGPALDTGTIADYLAANLAWLEARSQRLHAHPDAVIAAPADRAIVLAGAQVRAPIERVLVWPGAVVTEPASDAVVTPFGVFGARAAPG